ncbi:MAG: hypothetical protein ACP5N3_01175 [Candidatus Nanoarchaeia archaeon]
MSDLIKQFHEIYGVKPIFAGVYTNNSIETMCNEVKIFMENGLHVYLEPVRFRQDASCFSADVNAIETVLDIVSHDSTLKKGNGAPKIGINFLFRPEEAHRIAVKYSLSFMANDAISGKYAINEKYCDKNHKLPDAVIKKIPGIYLFAGITPGYLINQTPSEKWNDELQKLNEIADVVLVGNGPALAVFEQLEEFKQNKIITKPTIAAQGVGPENFLKLLVGAKASGAVIGSRLRDANGEVSLEKINEVKKLQELAIKAQGVQIV